MAPTKLADGLRARAEQQVGAGFEDLAGETSPERLGELIHELRVHQIELEMQNEELRRTAAELTASTERYFDLYDLAPVGYLTFSRKGLLLQLNLTAARLLGETRNRLVKQPLSKFFLPEDLGTYFQHRKMLFDTGEPQTSDLQLLTQGGAVSWVRLESMVAKGQDGTDVGRAAMIDVTKSKVVERRLALKADALEDAMGKLAVLSALVSICRGCMRIQDDQGRWLGFESYLAARSGHEPGKEICGDCLKKQSPVG